MLYPKDSGLGAVAPLALKNVYENNKASLVSYGDFYASLNRRIAASYAANSPCGSELLRFLDGTISALRHHGAMGLDQVLGRYPDLNGLIAASHQPVVLELEGIAIERLLHEGGHPFTEDDIAVYEELTGMGARMPGSVRVNGPVAPHVNSIFRIHIAQSAPPPGFIEDDSMQLEEFGLDELFANSDANRPGAPI
jgi:hypothetical protein